MINLVVLLSQKELPVITAWLWTDVNVHLICRSAFTFPCWCPIPGNNMTSAALWVGSAFTRFRERERVTEVPKETSESYRGTQQEAKNLNISFFQPVACCRDDSLQEYKGRTDSIQIIYRFLSTISVSLPKLQSFFWAFEMLFVHSCSLNTVGWNLKWPNQFQKQPN